MQLKTGRKAEGRGEEEREGQWRESGGEMGMDRGKEEDWKVKTVQRD